MSYSDVIRTARKARGWSQQELADRVGVQQPTVQRWEAGTRAPEVEIVPALAEALDVERHELANFEYEKFGLAPSRDAQASAEIVDFWGSLDLSHKEAIRDLAGRLRGGSRQVVKK